MAIVKGSKKLRVKVIEYRLRSLIFLIAIPLFLIFLAAGASYFYGHKIGMAGQEKALDDVARLSMDLSAAQKDVARLEQALANVELSSEVDKQSNEEVRQEVISLKDEIAKLEEENGFYRGLMAPNETSSGLTIGAVELVATRQERIYSYKVVIQQLATRHAMLSGTVNFTIRGRWNGLEHSFALKDVSQQYSAENIKLRFKYFQVLDGELTLPDGFEPEGIEIVAKVTGSKPQTQTKKFGWLVQES